MTQSRLGSLENDSNKFLDSMTFASLLPVLYVVLLAGIYCSFAIPKVQVVFFITAWSVAAVSILRIQQLIEHYSHGRYPVQTGLCVFLLGVVIMGPWLWLGAVDVLFHTLVSFRMLSNTHTSWICSFTIGATVISLLAVSPMIEGWYELLRGSFAFDGSRIKSFNPSFWAQVLLFGLFSGILLLPMVMASNHPTYSLDTGDTSYIMTGFLSTYLSMIWLVHQLERIREAQVSLHSSPRSVVDSNLLKRSSPLSAMLKPSHRMRPIGSASTSHRHASVRRPLPLSYSGAVRRQAAKEASLSQN